MVVGSPEDMLPYDDADDGGLGLVFGSPGIFNGRVVESEEGGEFDGEANVPRSSRPESGGVA
jgi:hypothetical protein